ncbi:hypothetical protein EV421DRAFT_1340495 [Armillaria borealis]|uniref:Uncharacterized protein n=1 Tax=Armillaria borealis TaxID=47425 RepID=A0AA39MIB3_9AGAR|nr:hypothetical protein EV421DRAFT_1340495 [Armillaria borealis]
MWNASTGELSKAFPDEVEKGLAVGVTDMEAYGQALRMFHKKHGCLVDPWPEELVYSMNQSIGPSANISVTVGMFTGELRTWSIIDRLDRVRVPTFVINGRADIAQDFVVEPLFRGIRQVKRVTMEKSSYTPMWEERESLWIWLMDSCLRDLSIYPSFPEMSPPMTDTDTDVGPCVQLMTTELVRSTGKHRLCLTVSRRPCVLCSNWRK